MYLHIFTCIYMYFHIFTYSHVFTYIDIYLHIYIYTHIYMYLHIFTYIYISLHVFSCIYVYLHIFTHIHSLFTFRFVHIYLHLFTSIHMHVRTHTHIYIYIYTYIQKTTFLDHGKCPKNIGTIQNWTGTCYANKIGFREASADVVWVWNPDTRVGWNRQKKSQKRFFWDVHPAIAEYINAFNSSGCSENKSNQGWWRVVWGLVNIWLIYGWSDMNHILNISFHVYINHIFLG